MKDAEKKRKLKDKLKDRYRLVILNESTLEDVWYAVLSRINFIVWIGFFGIILVAVGIILVSFTPLKEYIPGYPDGNIRWLYLQNTIKVDSLESQIKIRDQYIENIRAILKGKPTNPHTAITDTISSVANINFNKTNFDSVLNKQIQEAEKYNVSAVDYEPEQKKFEIHKLHFYCPLKGTITNLYDAHGNHYGVDIVSTQNEPILSVLDGTVVFAGWTLEAGYVIQVQHNNDLLSVYKHNSQLLKKMGDRVRAGEAIAIVGNTGELTTGPHLHFELWYRGAPLNPANYIIF